jgi:hypothetical protein
MSDGAQQTQAAATVNLRLRRMTVASSHERVAKQVEQAEAANALGPAFPHCLEMKATGYSAASSALGRCCG